MAKYILSNKAVNDLADIWNYIYDTWSEKQADKYYTLLIDICQALAEGKIIGKKYEVVSIDLSGLKVGQHIIFYRKSTGDDIEVARILHSRMDLKNKTEE
ncbi:MAG TPA: type II toxin-antitoxin system RelE/ParE family toxin [Chitinophagaceae bacterium]|nr:type II toxin-antitoxin system RelE/ParE family toxin [Chitinophagaceae bacterium]HPH31934.1 type II toxin-antitoxin system RelE/ParE family toxin [Chitinophagaceae bacterium]